MQSQFEIPSFNPSLASSRKSQMQTSDLPTSTKHNFNKKLFEPEIVQAFNQAHQDQFQTRCDEQFWSSLYAEQNQAYKTMMNKYKLLEESIKLHKQALTLRNSQYIDHEDRISNLAGRIRQLTGKAKQNEEKISAIGCKCHDAKSQIESIRSKIHKQQSIIIEQEKHVEELHRRMVSMRQQMKGIEKQLAQAVQKEQEYESIVEENQNLLLTLNKMRNQANFAKIKVDKDWSQEENIVKKMKELEKIIKIKQKNNRELGKKLVQLKKLNPEIINITNGDRGVDKGSKVRQIVSNIKEMEEQYGKIQQQIYEYSEKIYTLSDKMEQKIKNMEIIKMKQKDQTGSEAQSNIYHPAVLKNQTKSNTHEESKFPSNVLETNEQSTHNVGFMKKPPRGYKVIESEQNERYIYPKSTGKNETIQNDLSKKLEKSQSSQSQGRQYSEREKSSQLIAHSRQRSQNSKQEQDDHNLEIDENLRKLVQKFHSYKNNSLFKH